MVAIIAPIAIIFGLLGAGAFVITSFWDPISGYVENFGNGFRSGLELAGMKVDPQRYVIVAFGIGAAVWTALILLLRPGLLMGIVLLALCAGITAWGAGWFVRFRRKRRIAAFQDQLEQALRALAGGVRVGLGIRQAFVMTAQESHDPVKSEFTRVVGLSNVGVSLLDAFDQMAARMTNPETAMLARVLRVQSQTGGNLGAVLIGLADTIRDRRRLMRRVNGITAQGRATGWLLGLLPVALGTFLALFEPTLRNAMLFTPVGQLFLGVALFLDALSIFSIMKIVQIDP
jgi:tight adherence protein B